MKKLTRSSVQSSCNSCSCIRRMPRRQTVKTRSRRRIRFVTFRRFWFGIAAVALAVVVVVVVAAVDVVVIVVVVVFVTRFVATASLVSPSARLERVFSLAIDTVKQKFGDGLPRDECVVIGNLSMINLNKKLELRKKIY